MSVKDYYCAEGRIRAQFAHATGLRTAYLADALGSVTATSVVPTAVENTYRHRPHGAELARTGSGPDPAYGWLGELGYREAGRKQASHYVRARHFAEATFRWTTVDPYWPGEAAYGYVDGNPINWSDASGKGEPDWYMTMTNFFAGAGDSLTFGITARIRQGTAYLLGVEDVVDTNSTAYKVGEYTEMGAEIVFTCGSVGLTKMAAKAVAREGSTTLVRKLGTQVFNKNKKALVEEAVKLGMPKKTAQSMATHHKFPLFGHPLEVTKKAGVPANTWTLFPSGGLPVGWANAKRNLKLYSKEAHIKLHARMLKAERRAVKWFNRYTTTLRIVRSAHNTMLRERKETPARRGQNGSGTSTYRSPSGASRVPEVSGGGYVIPRAGGNNVID